MELCTTMAACSYPSLGASLAISAFDVRFRHRISQA
eukprot:SAG31_NODE_23769_length_496_cov_1.045340_2_plen_35_part_01